MTDSSTEPTTSETQMFKTLLPGILLVVGIFGLLVLMMSTMSHASGTFTVSAPLYTEAICLVNATDEEGNTVQLRTSLDIQCFQIHMGDVVEAKNGVITSL